jgi:hypothetical protein
MAGWKSLCVLGASLALTIAAVAGPVHAADTAAIDGTWEGPWYRGMSSGRASFHIRNGAGSLQLTNAESFGDEAKALSAVDFDGQAFKFSADGGGGRMTATLKLNDRGDQMKGMGKYEGFGVRFELTRVAK